MAKVTKGNAGRPAQLITSATLYGVLNLHLNDLDVRGLPSAAGVAQLSTANGSTTAAAAAAPPADAAPAAEAGSTGAADAAKRVRNLQKKLRQVRPWLTDTLHLGPAQMNKTPLDCGQCIFLPQVQVQQLKERASKEGQSALDADQRAKLATEAALIQEIRANGGAV